MRAKTKAQARNAKIRLISLASFISVNLLLQFYRVLGTIILIYDEINTIIIKHENLPLFESTTDIEGRQEDVPSRTDSEEYVTVTDFELELENVEEKQSEDPTRWEDGILLSLPCMEVIMSMFLIYLISGPLSKNLPFGQWLKWLIGMRIFWMRLIWSATAVTYCILVICFRKAMYRITGKTKYLITPGWMALVSLLCVEYFILGMLECFMKIMSNATILRKIRKGAEELPKFWRKLHMLSYHVGLFAYVARNFSMSLYFGLLTVFVTEEAYEDPKGINPYTGLTLVLQVYLSLIRGRFYGLFMHAFLSAFFVESDDDRFKTVKEENFVKDDENTDIIVRECDEKSSLKKHRTDIAPETNV